MSVIESYRYNGVLLMTVLPIAITILEHNGKFLFIKRVKPPYENLWSLVGGKVNPGEHIKTAAVREIKEETGAVDVANYSLRGFVSERLVDANSELLSQFLIFIGHAEVSSFSSENREGVLSLFTLKEIKTQAVDFLPSDLKMFTSFHKLPLDHIFYEAELIHDDGYHLNYFRRS